MMRRIKPYVPSKTLQDIFNGLVMPYFDYCSLLWDTCGKGQQDKLQKFQNRAVISVESTMKLVHQTSWKA